MDKVKFVKVYMQIYLSEEGTLEDVAKKFHMEVANLRVRCAQLRAAGVELPYFPRQMIRKVEVTSEDLNKIISKELLKKKKTKWAN